MGFCLSAGSLISCLSGSGFHGNSILFLSVAGRERGTEKEADWMLDEGRADKNRPVRLHIKSHRMLRLHSGKDGYGIPRVDFAECPTKTLLRKPNHDHLR